VSASDNLSNELFFTAHRGLAAERDYYGQTGRIRGGAGIHWSADKDVAESFSRNIPEGRLMNKPIGTVISAHIPMSSVETDTNVLKKTGVLNKKGKPEWPQEQEVTVKKGAPIHITEVTRQGSYSRDKAEDAREELLAKPYEELVPGYQKEYDKWDTRANRRTRRVTKRFNPPKEMKA